MQGRRSALRIEVDDHTRATLAGWLRRQKTPVGLAKRARAILLLAEGTPLPPPPDRWSYANGMCASGRCALSPQGIDGLYDKKRPGRRPVFSPGGGVVCGQTGL